MWQIADRRLQSRLLIGTALFSSLEVMVDAIRASKADVITVSIRRENMKPGASTDFAKAILQLGLQVLPNTAGCKTIKDAVTTAHVARELFGTNWIKLEIIGDDYSLHPDTTQLVEASRILLADGFEVLPYTTEDLCIAQRLVEVGCRIVMPWAAPIGSGQGPLNLFALKTLRRRLPTTTLIVDAGIGKPSHAAQVLEMGFDAVLINSAVALSHDPVAMARAFSLAVESGYLAHQAGVMPTREMASPSTPMIDKPFWHREAQA